MNDASSDTRRGSTRPRRESPESHLRTARLEKGFTQAELAARAGLSPGWISLLERSPEFITARTSQRLAEVLGVTEQEIRP
jgi:transcriptional regulator with XRE-family HTH domain